MKTQIEIAPRIEYPNLERERAYQEHILRDVSRTFALTIPQLPETLRTVVGNAYLLCRIADTIEDCPDLSIDEKRRFYDQFIAVLERNAAPEPFGEELSSRLAGHMRDAECDLIAHTPDVVRLTHSFSPEERAALLRCVRVMAEGMEAFQDGEFSHGLHDQRELDAYCYYVAGVVGEMLTELFCLYSSEVAKQREKLSQFAISFGQGLQMTNILKDLWDDRRRDACWLPQSAFSKEGVDFGDLDPQRESPAFAMGLGQLIGIARAHLENALTYTLLIPRSEQGIRRFCLWAIGMAVLTLRKIDRNRSFSSGQEVKISRRSVKATILVTNLIGGSNTLLRVAFRLLARRLPRAPLEPDRRSA